MVDSFNVGKMNNNISKGRNKLLETVIYKNKTIGSSNSDTEYTNFSIPPTFSINGGYVAFGTTITLSTTDNSEILPPYLVVNIWKRIA